MGQYRDDHRVLEISQKGAKGNREQRQKLLERVAKQVQPVMKKRRWTVQLLSELPPSSTGRLWGLNIDGGREIKIRLIEFGSKDQYLPYEAIIGTMLHELCHNEVGPHNAQFYKLLDQITLELEDFMAKGITGTGEGFDAPSAGRLGGSGSGAHNVSRTELRGKMVQAAEARAKRAGLMPSGPRKLGGPVTHLTPREAAAAAAERRARDDAGCACGAKGSTSFTEAEVIELESQPSSAAPLQRQSKPESSAKQAGNASQSSSRKARVDRQASTNLRARAQHDRGNVEKQSQATGEHQQQGDNNLKRGQARQEQEGPIDLTADSDGEPEVEVLE